MNVRRLAATVAALALVLTGCGTSAQDLPLPGSRLDGESRTLHAEVDDALNLAVGAPVKRSGVTIGRVRDIAVRDFRARVSMDVLQEHRVPAGTTAVLRATTPLGELYVEMEPPARPGPPLADGASLGTDDTSVAPTIEDTMSAASMLINGGGLGQVQTIVDEANNALGGREDEVREAVRSMARTTGSLADSDPEIGRALAALAEVAEVLEGRRDVVDEALTDLRPAAKVLRENTDELVELLEGVDALGGTAVDVIERSSDDLRTMLAQMWPVLEELNSIGGRLRPGLQTLTGFARLIDEAVPAEYLNTYLYFQVSVTAGVPNLPLVEDLPGVGDVPPVSTDTLLPAVGELLDALPPLPIIGSPTRRAPAPTTTPGADGLGLRGLLGGGR